MRKVAFLFNSVRTNSALPRSHYFGMYGLRDRGFETTFLEVEQFFPLWLCQFLRKYVLNIFFIHLLLFPLFFRYDIIFSSTAYASLVLKTVLRIKSFKWVILDFNIIGTIGERKTLKQKVFAYAVSQADGIITISEAEKNGLLKIFPHLAGRIEFIHEATDIEFFTPTGSKAIDPKLILSVGAYGRDFKTLIESVKDTDFKLTIATKPALLEKLLPLPINVTTSFFSPKELRAIYEEAAIVVVPIKPAENSFDSIGTLALGEAMAMKKCVIVSDVPSMHSYITDSETGIFFAPGNAQELKEKIVTFMISDNLEKREIMAHKAFLFAKEYLTEKHFSEKLALFFNKL
jgi:glycosyltransferase involved in cell wall biosynthesis